jgi:hypothetical protein
MKSILRMTISLIVLGSVLLMLPVNASAELSISVKLSASSVNPGEVVYADIRINSTSATPIFFENVTIILSHTSTGLVYLYRDAGLDYFGRLNFSFTVERPANFGEYIVWVRYGNISAFAGFTLEPSVFDLWDQIQEFDEANQEGWAVAKQAILLAFLITPFGVSVAILFSYWQWRIPNPSKSELKFWLLSHFDSKRLNVLRRDIRDLARTGYMKRHFPVVGKLQDQTRQLKRDQTIADALADTVQKRIDIYEKRLEKAKEFKTELVGISKECALGIAQNEESEDGELDLIQVRNLEKNRKRLPSTKKLRKDIEAQNLRQLLTKKKERSE